MSGNDNEKIISTTSSKEYIKYSSKENEKQAVEALYNYYNTKKYVKLMQAT